MNSVIHVVHAKSNVFFTITITSSVDAIHHPCLQLGNAEQSLSPLSIVLRAVKYAPLRVCALRNGHGMCSRQKTWPHAMFTITTVRDDYS